MHFPKYYTSVSIFVCNFIPKSNTHDYTISQFCCKKNSTIYTKTSVSYNKQHLFDCFKPTITHTYIINTGNLSFYLFDIISDSHINKHDFVPPPPPHTHTPFDMSINLLSPFLTQIFGVFVHQKLGLDLRLPVHVRFVRKLNVVLRLQE